MTRESIEVTRQDRIYCLKASSDYHSELCEECRFYPKCDHMTQDDMTELTIKDLETLEQEPCKDAISRQAAIDCLNADFTIDGKENMETVVDYINGAFKKIKALPSITPQPFINKPCVSEGVCREDKIQVLDKIKEEIKDNTYFINETTEKEGIDFETVEKIIDKYKAERRDKE